MTEKFMRGEAMGTAPFGYRIDSEHKTFAIDDERAEIVREVFRSYANGAGLREIAVRLGGMGVTTRRGNPPDNRFVEYMLRNPVYIGKIRWTPTGKTGSSHARAENGAQIVPGKHPPIISLSLWQSVQNRMTQQKAAYGRYQRSEQIAAWPMKGLARCSSCGATLICTQKHTACPSLQCHNYARGSCRVSHSLSLRKAETTVQCALQSVISHLEFTIAPRRISTPSSVPDFSRRIEQERRKLQRCKEAYQSGVDTLEEYRENKTRLTENIRQLTEQSEALAPSDTCPPVDLTAKTVDILSFLNSEASPDAKNKVLREIIDHIVYDKANHRLAIYFYK